MFGFSLAAQLFQGSALRTWNCVTQFTNQLWYKFNYFTQPIMPRSRRRHHSRSRSRSRSHSHDRDRDAKRRKIDAVDSPAHKRSVSAEPQSPENRPDIPKTRQEECKVDQEAEVVKTDQEMEAKTGQDAEEGSKIEQEAEVAKTDPEEEIAETHQESQSEEKEPKKDEASKSEQVAEDGAKIEQEAEIAETDQESQSEEKEPKKDDETSKPMKQLEEKLKITPKKTLSPKQVQKKLESEKKRQQRQLEREEREKKKQEEKERSRLEKEQLKKQKEEMKNKKNEEKEKEREQKRKERKEKEEREEAKRKEREQEKMRKQQEIDEKNREKQKIEEKKQKAAQAFANFFVPKKTETKNEEIKTKNFMPFQVKSDMRLPPSRRPCLTEIEKTALMDSLNNGSSSYLKDIKKLKRHSPETWPYEEEVIIIEEDIGESICEDKLKPKKMRVKFLQFHENKRPAYCGTWRKKSQVINPRKPFKEDKAFFDYDVDSDDDWEEEEQGESLNGSDDEEKENAPENDDYEVDNEFFVPHGHLSDDEVDDEELAKLSPESHKQKLKLLKDEFDLDMQAKTNKMKPRSIGCIWYNKDGSNVDEAIDRHLRPLAMITNGTIFIKKRRDVLGKTPTAKVAKELSQDLIPAFLKLISGNVNKRKTMVEEFMNYMRSNGHVVDVSKAYLGRCVKQFATWKKCGDEGPMFNKFCWCLEDDFKKKYNVE